MKRFAFTMIELVFVIVVLGILAAVALPKMGGVLDSSRVASAKGDVAAIRASIASARQKNLVKGKNKYISKLTVDGSVGKDIFEGDGTDPLLTYPLIAKANGGWVSTGAIGKFKFSIDSSTSTIFTYYPTVSGAHKAGTFDCDHSDDLCKKIVE